MSKHMPGILATVVSVLFFVLLVLANNANRESFMRDCLNYNTPFECEYTWREIQG